MVIPLGVNNARVIPESTVKYFIHDSICENSVNIAQKKESKNIIWIPFFFIYVKILIQLQLLAFHLD